MTNRPGDGVEISISAKDQDALSLIGSIQEGLDKIRASAELVTKSVSTTTAAILKLSSASVVTGITRVANAIAAIHKVSKIPIVEQQIRGIYESAGQAFTELAPLSRILKDVGGAVSYLNEKAVKQGFGEVLKEQSRAFRDDFSKMLGPGLEGQLKKTAERLSKFREENARLNLSKSQKNLEAQESELKRIRDSQRGAGLGSLGDESAIQAIVDQEERVFQARKKNQEALQRLSSIQNQSFNRQIQQQIRSVSGFEQRVEKAFEGVAQKTQKFFSETGPKIQRSFSGKAGGLIGRLIGADDSSAIAKNIESRITNALNSDRVKSLLSEDGALAEASRTRLQGFLKEKTGERIKEIASGRVLKDDPVSAISDVVAPGLFRIVKSDEIFKSARKELVSGLSSAFVAASAVAEDKSFDLGRALGRSFSGAFRDYIAKEAGVQGKGNFFERGILEAVGDTARLAASPVKAGAGLIRGGIDRLTGKRPKGAVGKFFDLFKEGQPESPRPDSIDRLYEGDKRVSLDQIIGGIVRPTLDDFEKTVLTNVGRTLSQSLVTQRNGAGFLEKFFLSKQQVAVGNLIQKGVNAGAKTAESAIATVLRQTVERGLSAALPKGEEGELLAQVVDFALNSKALKRITAQKSKEIRDGLQAIVRTPTDELIEKAPRWVASLFGEQPRQGGEVSDQIRDAFRERGRGTGERARILGTGEQSRANIVDRFRGQRSNQSLLDRTQGFNRDLLSEIEARIAALPKEIRDKIAKPFQDVAQTASGLITEIGGLAISVGGRMALGGAIGMPIPTDFGLVQDLVRTISGSERKEDIGKNIKDLFKQRFAPDGEQGLGLLGRRGGLDLLFSGNLFGGAALAGTDALGAAGEASKAGKEFGSRFQQEFAKSFTAQNLGPIAGFAKNIATLAINTVKAAIRTANFLVEVQRKFKEIDDFLGGALSESLNRISTRFVQGFVAGLTEAPRQGFADLINFIDQGILQISQRLEELPGQLQVSLDLIANPAGYLAGINEPIEVFDELQSVVGTVSEKVNEVSQQIFFFTSAFDSLQSLVANGPYQMLVEQNVELQKQLLETRAGLVSTNKIIKDGQQIVDPTSAIQALDAPVQSAIAKIRRDSLELVGVTSKDLVGVFNIINRSAAQANISLKQSADLTSSFSAALGTLGIPLNQASQEINSILTAQIDQNSVLAKTLSLDNDRVQELTRQGKLYDFLTEKLKAFRAGNALAAKTIEGVSSNIQEVFDNIALEAGAQLIEPIVEQLTRFYDALNSNKAFLTDYVTGLVAGLVEVGLSLSRIVESIGKNLGGVALVIPEYLFKELTAGAEQLADAVSFALELFRPFFELIAKAAGFIIPNLVSPFFKVAITLKVVGGVIGGLQRSLKILMQLLPGLGQLLFLVTIRTAPLVQEFVNLKAALGGAGQAARIAGAGVDDAGKKMGLVNGIIQSVTQRMKGMRRGFDDLTDGSNATKTALALLAGRELASIPGAMDAVARSFGVFGGVIAPLIPQISKFAIVLLGLNKQFPITGILNEAAGVITGTFLPAIGQVAKQKGFEILGDQVEQFGKKANDRLATMDLLSVFAEKVDTSVKEAGKSMAQSAITMVTWTAAIAAAVIVIVELWKRSKDAGDQIDKLSAQIGGTAQLIRSTWDQTKEAVDKPLFDKKNLIPPTDWIDSWILGAREIETALAGLAQGSTESISQIISDADSAKDVTMTAIKVIGSAIVGIARIGKGVSEIVFGLFRGIATAIYESIRVILTILKNPFDTKAIEKSFKDMAGSMKDVVSDARDGIKEAFGEIETKGEKSFREISAAISEGGLDKATQEVVDNLDKMEQKIASVEGGSGALFSDALAPVEQAIAKLQDGTGTVKEVKDAIASVGQSFPELSKDLEGISTQLGQEFPGDVITASKSIEGLEKSLARMKSDGKDIGGIESVVQSFKDGKASISDVLSEINKYSSTLKENDYEGKKEAQGLAAPLNALQKSIDGLDASASNRKMADIRAGIDRDIQSVDKQLQELEAMGEKGFRSEEARRFREKKAILEAARERAEAIAEAVKQQADPFSRLESELGNAKTEIEKAMGDISNAQKESIAKIRVAQNANLDMDTGKERILSDSQARIEILKQETAAIQKEIPARYEALQKLLKLWNEMTPEEQDSTRGKDLKRQMDAEQAALYEASANGAEKRAELEKAIAEKSISDIDRANKVALEKAQQAESERLVMLTQMRSQGLITAEEFEKQKADASVATAKKELEEQQKVLKSLEELPKPNDPDEAREREERIRAEKLKTSQATLKLIEAENAAYEAQTRKILAEIERRNDIIRAGLERRGRSGEITDSEKAEKEAALELKRLRAELAREKDANKRAELQLQLEKAKTSLQNARRQKEQEEFDRKLSEAEAAQLQAQREGGIDAEKAYTAVLERRLAAARRAVAIAKDANEKAKAQLELQRVLNDLEVDRIDRNLKAIENSYKRQNNSLQSQVKLFELAERSLANQKELIDAGNQLRASIGEYYDQTLGALSSLEKSDYRRRQLAEVTATIKLQAAIQEVKIAEQTLAIEQQMKRLALEREKIQARIAENEKLGNIKRLEAEEKKARIKGVSPEELEAIRIERRAAEEDYQLAQQSTALIDQQVAAQEDIFLIQQKIQQMQSKGKVEGAAANLIQNMADPGNQFNASEAFKEYLSQQLGAGSYSQLREGGLQSARNFQDQFFGQGFSRAGLQRDFFDIGKSLRDSQNQSFIATLPGASQRAIRPTTETRFGDSWSAASSPEARDLAAKYYSPSEMDRPQVPQIAPAGDLGEITGYVRGIFERMTTSEGVRPASKGGVEVTIQSLTVSGNISSSGSVDSGFSTNFRRELEKVFNEAARQSLV